MNFKEHDRFSNEFKKMVKKWPSLKQDIEVAKRIIKAVYTSDDNFRKNFFASPNATVLHKLNKDEEIAKIRLDCKSLNKKILRLVFLRQGETIVFIEVFSKNNKGREDQRRLRPYLQV